MIASAFKRCVPRTSRPVRHEERAARSFDPSPSLAGFVGLALVTGMSLGLSGEARAASGLQFAEHYVQYGAGLTGEPVVAAAAACPSNARAPCILGSGVGLSIRVGYRSRGPWYFGGAYEFSRQDSSNLLRIGILQQLRAETRFYALADRRVLPYVAAAVGGAVYGNEWGIDTGGLTAFLGPGVEFQVSGGSVVGAMLGYRPVAFRRWEDSAGQVRADGLFGFGVSHLIGVELVFELRDPLPRW